MRPHYEIQHKRGRNNSALPQLTLDLRMRYLAVRLGQLRHQILACFSFLHQAECGRNNRQHQKHTGHYWTCWLVDIGFHTSSPLSITFHNPHQTRWQGLVRTSSTGRALGFTDRLLRRNFLAPQRLNSAEHLSLVPGDSDSPPKQLSSRTSIQES